MTTFYCPNGSHLQREADPGRAQQSRHIVTCQIEWRDKIKPSGRALIDDFSVNQSGERPPHVTLPRLAWCSH